MKSLFVFVVGLALSVAAWPSNAQSDTKDLEAIRQIERDWQTAWNRHDMKALTALVAEDVDFVTVAGLWLKGRKEFEDQHTAIHAMRFKESVRTTTDVQVKFLKPDVAIVHVSGVIKGEKAPDGTPLPPRQGIFTRVVTKEGGKWLIKASQNTAIRAAAATK
jgi:uncharacterized protein (TIGR02246 family)